MSKVIAAMYKVYRLQNEEWSDPRTGNWPLLSTPWLLLAIVIVYFYGVTRLGTMWMSYRKPFKLDRAIIVYNVLQVVANLSLFIKGIFVICSKYDFWCEPIDYSTDDHAMEVARMVYYYFLLKFVDLFDTVFFVLRKKNAHLSFLHVYHHVGILVISWGGCKYFAGGQGVFLGLANTFVHSIMYTYYLLTSWNSEYKKSIWWKKYVTQLQMIQFLLISVQQFITLLNRNCSNPSWISWFLGSQNMFMFVLFVEFYMKAYSTKIKDSHT